MPPKGFDTMAFNGRRDLVRFLPLRPLYCGTQAGRPSKLGQASRVAFGACADALIRYGRSNGAGGLGCPLGQ